MDGGSLGVLWTVLGRGSLGHWGGGGGMSSGGSLGPSSARQTHLKALLGEERPPPAEPGQRSGLRVSPMVCRGWVRSSDAAAHPFAAHTHVFSREGAAVVRLWVTFFSRASSARGTGGPQTSGEPRPEPPGVAGPLGEGVADHPPRRRGSPGRGLCRSPGGRGRGEWGRG